MALTDTAIRKAKPREKDWKLADERGLYLLVTPGGSKLWRFKYRVYGKEKKLALGCYPDLGLKEARARRDDARKRLEDGIDPGQAKKDQKIATRLGTANTFAAVAGEYIERMEQEERAPVTVAKVRWLLTLLTPAIGARPIAEVTPHELLAILKKIEHSGKRETASRMRSFASRVFRFAIATARASNDPARHCHVNRASSGERRTSGSAQAVAVAARHVTIASALNVRRV